MKAQLKCSSCGAEITNLNMSWGKKQWLWFIPLIVFMIFIPFIMDSWFRDSNDFRSDLSIKDIENAMCAGVKIAPTENITPRIVQILRAVTWLMYFGIKIIPII